MRLALHPRQDMSGWDEYDANPKYPENRILPLTNGFLLENNKFKLRTGEEFENPYHADNPLQNTWRSIDKLTYHTTPRDNYSYWGLEQDPSAKVALAEVANQLHVPGRWLADTIALTTRGTFNPNYRHSNPRKSGALVATPEQIEDLEGYQTLPGQIREMGRYLRSYQLDTPYDIINAIVAPTKFDLLKKRPLTARVLNNGVYSLDSLHKSLGSFIGQQYESVSAEDYLRSYQHDYFVPHCRWCNAMQKSGNQIVPHQFQEAALNVYK